ILCSKISMPIILKKSGASLLVISPEPQPKSKTVKFLDEGNKKTSVDYGTSIVFNVEFGGEEMNFYVKENNFSLLKQIKELGSLIGTTANILRVGSKKSDTRYSIEKVEPKQH
ncbi:hypothetical protein LCGC14_3082520, partial [marine sediment metagenome]